MTNLRKLPPVDWPKARAEYEAGDSYQVLGLRYKRSTAAMSKRGRAESWIQDAEPAIRKALADRLAMGGKVAAGDPIQREAAIKGAVDARFSIVEKHRNEWAALRAIIYVGLNNLKAEGDDAESRAARASAHANLREAKLAAHALALVQAGERRAWSITEDNVDPPGPRVYRLEMVEDPYAED